MKTKLVAWLLRTLPPPTNDKIPYSPLVIPKRDRPLKTIVDGWDPPETFIAKIPQP